MIYIGIDLGGTKINAAVFSLNGVILHQASAFLEGRKGPEVGQLMIEIARKLLSQTAARDETVSIGVCVPGIAYSKTGTVWAPNISGWENYPLREELQRAFPRSIVLIESDRTCYILGETHFGAAKGCENAVFMAVGTGIGVGILIDGMVLHGKSDIVGAIGWMALKPPYVPEYDSCGCYETYASGTGLALQARKLLREKSSYEGVLRSFPIEEITSYHVFDAWESGDPIAEKVLGQAVEMWGMAAANIVSLFNPELVIFGGGVFGPGAKLLGRIYEEACKWAQPVSIRQTKFIATALPGTAGLYGAGAIAIQNAKTFDAKRIYYGD